MNPFKRAAPVMLTVLACGCLIAACGSSSSTTTNSAASGAASGSTGSPSARFSAFRTCLKQHGVMLPARRPRSGSQPYGGGPPPQGAPGGGPPPGGGFFGGGGGAGPGGPAGNPKLAAAIKACGGGNFRRGQRFRLSQTRVNAYVVCVRKHGYNLPKPNFSGKGPVFPSSIRSNPKFQAASKACQNLLIRPRPVGAQTTTTAKS